MSFHVCLAYSYTNKITMRTGCTLCKALENQADPEKSPFKATRNSLVGTNKNIPNVALLKYPPEPCRTAAIPHDRLLSRRRPALKPTR